jgi:uncharacterized protein (TIGR02466 family)
MRFDLFPTPIWIRDYPDMNVTPLLNLCKKLKDEDPDGRVITNIGGWQSANVHSETYEELKQLERYILQNSVDLLDQMGYDTNVCVDNLWFNINTNNSVNAPHFHSGILSGVFYLSLGKYPGSLLFHRDPKDSYIFSSYKTSCITPLIAPCISYVPVEKRLIIFPSWLVHSVDANKDNEPRISIAFNIIQT